MLMQDQHLHKGPACTFSLQVTIIPNEGAMLNFCNPGLKNS